MPQIPQLSHNFLRVFGVFCIQDIHPAGHVTFNQVTVSYRVELV